MKKQLRFSMLMILLSVFALIVLKADSCNNAVSTSGVSKATVQVETDIKGNTVEQVNIMDRLTRDNTPGSIKHLYVISTYSGQVIIYSTVKGKVTSGNKRLSPKTVRSGEVGEFGIDIGNQHTYTDEVLGDDGAYGESGDYIFWFDVRGVYHQHYLSGGQIIHISDQPLAVSNIIINIEQVTTTDKK